VLSDTTSFLRDAAPPTHRKAVNEATPEEADA
jgi:hypothetical protein